MTKQPTQQTYERGHPPARPAESGLPLLVDDEMNESGNVDGTADYAVYGEVRASSGVSTLFRFTGEQHDAETGFTYLRARYANPEMGRFVSADTVQPNAPGTHPVSRPRYNFGLRGGELRCIFAVGLCAFRVRVSGF